MKGEEERGVGDKDNVDRASPWRGLFGHCNDFDLYSRG